MSKTFLTGPAGTGKTTLAVQHLRQLLSSQIPASEILVVIPQRTLAKPYLDLLTDPTLPSSGVVEVITFYGLARRTIALFWPLVAGSAGFARPHARPVFLTIETAQYYLRQAIEPLLKQGYFDPNVVALHSPLPRLLSQLLDNLNKAALIGLPHTEIGARLSASLNPEVRGRTALEQAQTCLNQFRAFCLARNLLDFSLQIELFDRHLWSLPIVRQHLTHRYRHLIVDNLEEDTAFAHRILREWLPLAETALLINDEEAGYRLFLGANWRTAQALQEVCDETIRLTESHVTSAGLLHLGERVRHILMGKSSPSKLDRPTQPSAAPDPQQTLIFEAKRFFPQMLDWAVEQVALLFAAGTRPNEIVTLAPFVDETLSLSFLERMKRRGLPAYAYRPSRLLSDEPIPKACLTLVRLAFPEWHGLPPSFDVTQALHLTIADLDPIRASLLTQVVYRPQRPELGAIALSSFDQIGGELRDRITYQIGARFETLRTWLLNQRAGQPPLLDHLFIRLFEQVLAQPDFGFHQQPEAGAAIARLVESVRKFRWVAEQVPLLLEPEFRLPTVTDLNRAYLELVDQGLVAAQYLADWETASMDAVVLTPATTFLMQNRPVDYQIWLNAGSRGWWERIAQSLTHPYILSADWEPGRLWTDQAEVAAQRDRLYRLVVGLIRRCRKQIIVASAEIGEMGEEQQGLLLKVLQQVLHQMDRGPSDPHR